MSGSGETTVFDGDLVKRYRVRACAVREHIREDNLPTWCSNEESLQQGWFRHDFDAARLVEVFPALSLTPGFRFLTWIYRSSGNGNGLVLSFQEDDPSLLEALTPPGFPVPLDKLPMDDDHHPMHGVRGDGSPLSYLSAALLLRELREVGARWHGVSWDEEEIISTHRSRLYGATRARGLRDRWRRHLGQMDWDGPCPDPHDLGPQVRSSPAGVEAIFHTYSELGREHVTQHIDRFIVGSMIPHSESRHLATGTGGFVF